MAGALIRRGGRDLFESVVRSSIHEAEHAVPKIATEAESSVLHAGTRGSSRASHATQDLITGETRTASNLHLREPVPSSAEVRSAATNNTVHMVSDAESVAKAKGPKWKSTLAKSGPAYIGAGGVTGLGIYTAVRTDQRLGQLGSAVGQFGTAVRDDSKALAEALKEGLVSAANHMPNLSSIEEAVQRALDGAHKTVEGVTGQLAGPASTVLTITIILGTVVVVYEGYRFFN